MKSANNCPFPISGERIRELRKNDMIEKGGKLSRRTQGEAAALFGVSVRTFKDWEKGLKLPDGERLLSMAAHYSVSADYLLGISQTKTVNGDEVSRITGLSPAAVDYLHENHETTEGNALSWGIPITEWIETSPFPDCAAVLSRLIEAAPDGFYDLIHDINAYFLESTEAQNPADTEGEFESERNLKAALYSCSVSLSNAITAAARPSDPAHKKKP